MAGGLDDELLALAGGSARKIDLSSSDEESHRSRGAPKRSPSHASSLAKKRRLELLDESESGSDADAPGSDDDALPPTRRPRKRASSADDDDVEPTPYPYQGIYKSARDMEALMAMNELEREDILARRRDELVQRRQKVELAALVKAQQAAAGATKKAARRSETKTRRVVRGGDSESESDDDEEEDEESEFEYGGAASAAKSRRKKLPGQTDAKSAKLSELRNRRREKAAGTARGAQSDDDEKLRSRRGYASSDDDDSYASDADEDSARRKDPRRRLDGESSAEPPSLAELNAARISRERVESRLYAPRWKAILTGAFIRFSWGVRPRDDGRGTEEVYRIHQITDVVEKPGKFYNLSDDVSEPRWCNVYVAFEHAGGEHEARLTMLSRREFSESERERWLRTLHAHDQRIPRPSSVVAKADELERFFDTPLTEADIKRVLEQKKSIRAHAASVMGSNAAPPKGQTQSLEARLAAVHERNRTKDRRPDSKPKPKPNPSAPSAAPLQLEPKHNQPTLVNNRFVSLPNFAASVEVDLGDF